MRKTTKAIFGVVIIGFLAGSATAIQAIGGPDPELPQHAAEGLSHLQDGEKAELRPEEIRLEDATVVASFPVGDQVIVVGHGVNSEGKPRTIFARMVFEPGLKEWYATESWDRPNGAGFTWAQMDVPIGRAFVWDNLPPGRTLLISGKDVGAGSPTGLLMLDGEASEEGVTLR